MPLFIQLLHVFGNKLYVFMLQMQHELCFTVGI